MQYILYIYTHMYRNLGLENTLPTQLVKLLIYTSLVALGDFEGVLINDEGY